MSQYNSLTCTQDTSDLYTIPKESFFTEQELKKLDKARLPKHIAIIPDGNRRWAKEHARTTEEGHLQGADVLVNIVKAAKQLGIEALSVFSFSTENWHRSHKEVSCLMSVFEKYLSKTLPLILENNIRFSTIGNTAELPKSLFTLIQETQEKTKNFSEFELILAFNYGGRDEICRAVNAIIADMKSGIIKPGTIDETLLSSYLDTAKFSDPDLLIRTSGERRISNFLLWQSSYTELYFEHNTWPDFTPQHLLQAILDYQQRERRLGGGVFD